VRGEKKIQGIQEPHQYGTATTRLGRVSTQRHYKYNRHATTNQIILTLKTEVKKKISP